MTLPDYEWAYIYAYTRLEHELAPALSYHSLAHTCDDVVPATERLASIIGVTAEDLLLMRTAAWYHDIGFVEQRAEHEAISARIAMRVLPHFGYSEAQITMIEGMIMATRLPQTPHTLLEQIIADADLDSLGREDFLTTSLALRVELAAAGTLITAVEWYDRQLQFLRNHSYFTSAARTLRNAQKQQNIVLLMELLDVNRATRSSSR